MLTLLFRAVEYLKQTDCSTLVDSLPQQECPASVHPAAPVIE
jgi:hypothetical protein